MTLAGWLPRPADVPRRSADPLTVALRWAGDTATVVCAGELDLTTSQHFLSVVLRACGEGPATLRLDLADVAFVDSTGLRGLLRARARAVEAGAAVELVPSAQLRRLIALAGVRIAS